MRSGELNALRTPTLEKVKVSGKWDLQEVTSMCLAYSKMRNQDENPYSPEEREAAKYLYDLAGIGGGDDPVGCLIVSHRDLVRQRTILKERYPKIFNQIACYAEDEMLAKHMDPELTEKIDSPTE